MAQIGDVLVKFVANFAEFSTAMTEGQDQLVKFGEQASKTGSNVDNFLGLVKKGIAALGISEAIGRVKAYAEEIQNTAVKIDDMAKKVGVTTDQFQALEAMSRRSGVSVEELAKAYKGNSDAMASLVEDAKRLGLVMDEKVVKSLKDAAIAAEDADNRLKAFFAPAVAATKSWIADAFERMANDLRLVASHEGIIDKIAAILRMLQYGSGAGSAQANTVAQMEANVGEAERDLATLDRLAAIGAEQARQRGITAGAGDPAERERAVKRIEDARIALAQERDRFKRDTYGGAPLQSPPITVPGAAPTGGGSKGTEDDTIERQIARYTALAKNAQTAFATVFTGQNRYIDDLQREVRVQQQVDDIVARIAAKNHGAPTPEQIEALRQVVTIEQERRAETQKLLEAMTQAEALERRLGDGTKARALAERDLARQQQTGILSPEAARRAKTEQDERQRQQELTAKRTDDNLGSLTAGFENAANASVRAHDLFMTGGQAFEGLMGAMSESIDVLVGASNKGFDQIARDFALMLAKMAAQAALSQVFKLAVNALSSIGGGAAGGVSPGTVSPADWAAMLSANSGGGIAGMAGGGEVSAGRPYIVGERGPEFFVPNAAGSIVPMSQAGGGGVTVNVDMGQTVGASNPSQALDFGRKVRAAVMTVIQGEKRPGGTLHPATP